MSDISLDMLTLFQAISSEPAKAKVIEEIRDELAKVAAEREALKADRAALDHAANDAANDRAATKTMLDELHAAQSAVAEEQHKLAEVRDAMNAETAAFEDVRAKVDADHAEREATIAAKETSLSALEADLKSREAALVEGEETAAEKHESLDRKHAALRAALEA